VRESDFKGSREAQRESQSLNGSQPLGPSGREASSKTIRRVSWVEMTRQEAQEWEASRSRVSSRKGSCQTTGFASVTKGALESRICFGDRGGIQLGE
jgi:hypothetical protein